MSSIKITPELLTAVFQLGASLVRRQVEASAGKRWNDLTPQELEVAIRELTIRHANDLIAEGQNS